MKLILFFLSSILIADVSLGGFSASISESPSLYAADSPFTLIAPKKARPKPSKPKSPRAPSNPKGILVLNPETLRTWILDGNNSILTELNMIYQAKDIVNSSRANLLPSLNIGTVSGTSGFNLSTVSFLLPFLVPSNWFDLNKVNFLLEAEKHAYFALELNVFASAYALYEQVVTDMNLRDVYFRNYQILKYMADIIEREHNEFGTTTTSDVLQSRAQAQIAEALVSRLNEMLIQEKAALRQSLGMKANYGKSLKIERVMVAPSRYENQSLEVVLNLASKMSPENQQIQNLIKAAQEAKWSTRLAFLGGAGSSLASTAGAGQSASFSNISGIYSFKLTFATFPALELTNDNINLFGLRKNEIYLEQRTIVEATLGSLAEASQQLELAQSAHQGFRRVYDLEYQRYGFGTTDLLHVMNAQSNVLRSEVAIVQSQFDLNILRINLHRLTLADAFAKIKGCQLNRSAAGKASFGNGFFDWFKEIFDPSIDKSKINAICKGTPRP